MTGEAFRFGEGRISGFLSAMLGLMSLGGVLCFRYPAIFTTPDLVARLNVAHLRGLLLVVLLLAFVLGLINFLIGKWRQMGYLGMAAASLAVLLGGAMAEPDRSLRPGLLPLGLDFFLLGLLFYALLFVPFEKAFPHRREQIILRPEWQTDLGYFALANLLVSVLMVIVTASGPLLFGWSTFPALQTMVRAQPAWIQFVEMVVVADLAQYGIHRRYHENRWLWRLHAVHHSVRHMDWLAGSRLHLLEVIVTRVAVFVPLYWIGFSTEVLYAYIAFVSLHAVFIHANVGIDFGWLRTVVATPQFHHWHHSDDPKVLDKNFAVHLPVIDLLFRTYYQPRDAWPASYGLIGEKPPAGLLEQHLYPFRRPRKRPVKEP